MLQFTLSNSEGDTTFQMAIKGEPSSMQWAMVKNGKKLEKMLSMVLNDRTIFFHSTADPDSPIELAFQPKYGKVVSYQWFKDGLIMIGFASGYFVVISTSIHNYISHEYRKRPDWTRAFSIEGSQRCSQRHDSFKIVE